MKAVRYGAALLVLAGASVAVGRWASPSYVPVERLLENATTYVQEHREDASGYYALARIHYLAYANKAFLVGVFGDHTPPHPIPYWWWQDYLAHCRREEAQRRALVERGYESTKDIPAEEVAAFWSRVRVIEKELETEGWHPKQPGEEQLVEHAGAAQWNFYKAIALDPDNALYYLGQASLGEEYLEFLRERSPALIPAAVRAIVLNGVRDTYLLAYNLAVDTDLQRKHLPIEGLRGIIAYEAGKAYVRLWEAEEQIGPEVQEKLAGIKANLAELETLPPSAVTPVVFTLETASALADLLAPERVVRFDLDGDGVAEPRPWVKPTTGLLVWNPDSGGKILSGRQLFGSVTWWLFFSNGYRALDILDDNRDGLLTGAELRGISAWFDRNSNGRSDRGEAVSLERLGITALGTRSSGYDGECPMHRSGIRFRDGRTLPSYDWIAPAAKNK